MVTNVIFLQKNSGKYEPSLGPIDEEVLLEESFDYFSNEPTSKKPCTAEQYNDYRYVLPYPKSVAIQKHNKSLHQLIEAAEALGTSKTSRSRADGECFH